MSEWKRSPYCASGSCVEWRRSSYCANGACIEWQQPSLCSSGGCLEVGHEDHRVLLRDSKYEQRGEVSPVVEFTPSGWRSFLIVSEEWDRLSTCAVSGVILDPHGDEEFPVRILASLAATVPFLAFSWDEWDAFVAGVKAGEFVPEAIEPA